jgi:hypothetical protein
MKTVIKILLLVSIALLAYFCVMSVYTPIQFNSIKADREKEIVQRLIDIRTAQNEFLTQKGRYTGSFDTLITFLKTGKKKMVMKEGSLTEKQLEAGLNEKKAAEIVRKGNMTEIIAAGLQEFRRDTAFMPIIESIFAERFTTETIDDLAVIPHSNNQKFELKVNDSYVNSIGIKFPLFEASAHYTTFLSDLNRQELINVIDVQEKLFKFPGLKVGSVDEPNNNAGNWE